MLINFGTWNTSEVGVGRTNVYDNDRSGCPSLVIADLLDQVNEKIRENRPCPQ
jgi:hypothetical protein